ncbi:hypothetical protein Hanom_Chr04g00298621 [Helianthus anomalus]
MLNGLVFSCSYCYLLLFLLKVLNLVGSLLFRLVDSWIWGLWLSFPYYSGLFFVYGPDVNYLWCSFVCWQWSLRDHAHGGEEFLRASDFGSGKFYVCSTLNS